MADRTCSIDGCPRPHYGRGLCAPHYQKQRRAGLVCTVDRCSRTVEARGLCNVHYRRQLEFGDPNGGRARKEPPPRSATLREAFEWYRPGTPPPARVLWPWLGPTTSQGYGQLRHRGHTYVAHRLSYQLFVGPIPDGYVIRHRNDTPIDVSPNNLEVGTCADNTADIWERDRGNAQRGVDNGQAKLTDDAVREIRYRREELGETYASIARRFDVTYFAIRAICLGKTWRHVL